MLLENWNLKWHLSLQFQWIDDKDDDDDDDDVVVNDKEEFTQVVISIWIHSVSFSIWFKFHQSINKVCASVHDGWNALRVLFKGRKIYA